MGSWTGIPEFKMISMRKEEKSREEDMRREITRREENMSRKI